MKDLLKKFVLYDVLLNECVKELGVTISNEYRMPYTEDMIGYHHYEMIVLKNKIAVDNDFIDNVFFWNDGTFDFHLEGANKTLNWRNFDSDTLKRVIAEIVGKKS